MRNGIIGGWQLGEHSLTSSKQEIILWAGDPKNSDALKKTPYIRIGAINKEGNMEGRLWIADYQVQGQTTNNSIAIQNIGTDEVKLENNDFHNFDEDDAQSKVKNLTFLTTKLTDGNFAVKSLNSWSLKDDTDDNQTLTLGVSLKTAQGADSTKSIIIWQPTWKDGITISASLGTSDYPWTNIYANGGIFFHEKFTGFDKKEYTGWHLVATQDWVAKVVVTAVNERMKEINNLAAKALKKANDAIKKARLALSTLGGCKFVTNIAIKNGVMDFTDGTLIYNEETGYTWSTTDRTFLFSATTIPWGVDGGDKISAYIKETYYTKEEIDTLLAGYSKTDHNHDKTYSKTSHGHTSYASSGHNHDDRYVLK